MLLRFVPAVAAALALTLHASAASAQELLSPPPPAAAPSPPPDVSAPPPAAVPPPEASNDPTLGAAPRDVADKLPETSGRDVRDTDAHADRVILGSTAETHPQGTFFLSDYEVMLVQLGYAVTDDLQLSIAGVPPIVKEQPYFFDFGLKLNIVRTASFRAAVTGAFDVITTGGSSNDGPYYGGRLGGIGQFCFEGTCHSSLSLNVGTILASGSNGAVPVYGSAGFIFKASSLVSILAEPALFGVTGTGYSIDHGGAALVFDYGVRLSGKNFGVDLTFIEPVAATGGIDNNPFILGYPFVAFTYRTDGSSARSAATPGASTASTFANALGASPRGL